MSLPLPPDNDALEYRARVRVRFSEVDALRIVWHGHYAKYLEDAREGFARHFGLSHTAIESAGFIAPMTELHVEYLRPAREGDELEVLIRLERSRAARLRFAYEVHRAGTEELLARAATVQVFVQKDGGNIALTQPRFLRDFFRRYSAEPKGK